MIAGTPLSPVRLAAEPGIGDRIVETIMQLIDRDRFPWIGEGRGPTMDGRVMPIECKVSNSSTNSIKRLNNDAQVKAVNWISEFGHRSTVPAAVLSGVYQVRHLVQAQDAGLTLFWTHDIEALVAFVLGTGETAG
ncbi:MAG: XamI family restriction endonuclease [bacterium]|nr:XamI family restriction endonuclease [bacterium]